MTELEELKELKIVKRFLGAVCETEQSNVTYKRIKDRIDELEGKVSSMPTCDIVDIVVLTGRAQRAEAALSKAQDRALWFEKLLKAEEARKDTEPVLDKYRVLRTAMDISSQNTRTKSIAILSYHSIRLFLLEICGGTYTENVYRWK